MLRGLIPLPDVVYALGNPFICGMTTREQTIRQAADQLWEAEATGIVCEPVRVLITDHDLDLAYKVQEEITRRKTEAGEHIVGRKIGLTSVSVQKQIGVDQPDFGSLFASRRLPGGSSISASDMMQPRIECEIAFVAAENLTGEESIEELVGKLESGEVSLEIAGSRVKDWNIRITDTIADNASASHFVMSGNPISVDQIDLAGCEMKMWVNDELKSEGTGAACLDNPLNAVSWLAKEMASRNTPIQKGQIILSGALGPMVGVQAGDHVVAEIGGLGRVEISITD